MTEIQRQEMETLNGGSQQNEPHHQVVTTVRLFSCNGQVVVMGFQGGGGVVQFMDAQDRVTITEAVHDVSEI
ncbi:hypothetical protein MYX82_12735 [Acidobacteria bacterium AH-259-D05]|nr:hypothetical protein [Acidobacteria bacterium AH-259-D05]